MKDKLIIFSAALILILVLGFIAHIQFFRSRRNVIDLYSEKQMTLANQTAASLEAFIEERLKAVEVLANCPEFKKLTPININREFERTYGIVKGFEYLIYLDTNGIAQLGYPENFPCPSQQPETVRNQFIDAFNAARLSMQTVIFSKNVLVDESVFICLISPIYSPSGDFRGAILGILDVVQSLKSALPSPSDKNKDYTWILNDQGFLIYHPIHPEMLLQNIFSENSDCRRCHENFDYERQMMAEFSGFGIKKNLKTHEQVIAYRHVALENIEWIVAVSSPFKTVMKSMRLLFTSFLLLFLCMTFAVLGGSVFITRINSKRIAAQKESEYLRASADLLKEKRAAEIRYQVLVEQSPEPIFLCTRKKILMYNKSFTKLFKLEDEEITGFDSLFGLVPEDHRDYFEKEIYDFIKSKNTVLNLSLPMLTRHNNLLEVEISIRRFLLGRKITYQGIIHDTTERRKLERERRQQEHLALIGEMSARIAHEIKNPLASIQTGIQLLESQLEKDNSTKNYYERLRTEIQRVDKILKGLLAYAREDELEYESVELDQFISHFRTLLQPTLNKNQLKLEFNKNNSPDRIYIDPNKIEQVLWNIFLNAAQASPAGGTIYLEIKRYNEGINMIVRDEGEGISPKILPKLFMPFFSTRAQGSGLGLAISKKIVELHEGNLKIESNVNQGTTVIIYIPEGRKIS
ncbi:PAS domain S-box protein [candidate division KSB1 bacterium]|nr:PAS domain S-box protein [candidate division KSB1 bacterium]